MPTKRRRRAHHLHLQEGMLSDAQRLHLEYGHNFFDDEPPFGDDDHRRQSWERHRSRILAEWNKPGTRPVAFWNYERAWPSEAAAESYAVYVLSDTSEAERAMIETAWRKQIGVILASSTSGRAALERAKGLMPIWFFRRHAPAVRAEMAAVAAIDTKRVRETNRAG